MKNFYRIFTVIVFVVLYIPMFLLIAASFEEGKTLGLFTGFTFSNYTELFENSTLFPLLMNSLILAVLSALIATLIGTITTLGIHAMSRRSKRMVIMITNIPMTNPEIVTGVSLALLFVFAGSLLKINNVLGFWTLLIAHVTFNLPYVILSVMPKLSQMDPSLREAALDLGCTPVKAFFKVTIHELMPGIISGGLLAFTMSLDDFIITHYVTGNSFTTLPEFIYTEGNKKQLDPKIYALFTMLFIMILVAMIVMNVFQARESKRKASRRA